MLRVTLIVLHLLLGIGAIGAGQALARRPDGEALTFKTEWLRRSPFPDYRVPGLFLLFVIAPANLAGAMTQWRRRPAAPFVSFATGCLLVAWLAIQTAIIGFRHPSQLIWAVMFPAVAVLGALQQRR